MQQELEVVPVERVDAADWVEEPGSPQVVLFLMLHHLKKTGQKIVKI